MEEIILCRSPCHRLALSSSDPRHERTTPLLHTGYFWNVLAAKALAAEYLVRAIWPAFVHLNFFKTLSLQFSRSLEPRFRFLKAMPAIASKGIFRGNFALSSFPL